MRSPSSPWGIAQRLGVEAFAYDDELGADDGRETIADVHLVWLPELREEVRGELHLVGPDIAPANFVALAVDGGIVLRQALE